MEYKICTKCKRNLPLTEYYSRGQGKKRSECKECHKKYVNKKYLERKDWVDEIKFSQCCQKCGESRPHVLDFHHKDPSVKEEIVARMISNRNREEDIMNEIKKCIVLCSNCHRDFHFYQKRENLTLEDYLTK